MITKNIGSADRIVRIVIGVLFIALGYSLSRLVNPLRLFLYFWGILFLITSFAGF